MILNLQCQPVPSVWTATPTPYVPGAPLLAEDGTPLLNEDGTPLITE